MSTRGRGSRPILHPLAMVIGTVCELSAYAVAGLVVLSMIRAGCLLGGWLGAGLAMMPAYLAAMMAFLTVTGMVHRCCPKPQPGFIISHGDRFRQTLLLAMGYAARRSPAGMLAGTLIGTALLRTLWGLRTAQATTLLPEGFGNVPDPHLVEIGRDVVIGSECVLSGHLFTPRLGFLTGRITVGDGAVIGVRALIGPGVRIGAGAMVMPNSVVPPGTVIPTHGVWAGDHLRPAIGNPGHDQVREAS